MSVSNNNANLRGSQKLSPRGNEHDRTHFTVVQETDMDSNGGDVDDDGSDVQELLYDNESMQELEQENGSDDRELIEVFREASQMSLISDAQVNGVNRFCTFGSIDDVGIVINRNG